MLSGLVDGVVEHFVLLFKEFAECQEILTDALYSELVGSLFHS